MCLFFPPKLKKFHVQTKEGFLFPTHASEVNKMESVVPGVEIELKHTCSVKAHLTRSNDLWGWGVTFTSCASLAHT